MPFQKNLGQSINNKQKIKQSGLTAQIITNMYNGAKKINTYKHNWLHEEENKGAVIGQNHARK